MNSYNSLAKKEGSSLEKEERGGVDMCHSIQRN